MSCLRTYVQRIFHEFFVQHDCFKQLTHVSCFPSLSNTFSLVYNLPINRFTNEQPLQIIEFYYQNACSVKKIHARLFHFVVNLFDPLKRLFGLWWLIFAPNFLGWTLNYQHAYAECELKKISQLNRPVLMMTINYRFVAVRSSWASVTQQRGKFYGRI